MSETALIELVNNALEKLYNEQDYLIKIKVHERSIVFWFGIYFYELLKDSGFSKYDIDFDYNRNLFEKKTTKNFQDGIYPDIILHKRGNDNDNLLVIEFKKGGNQNIEYDISKLEDLTKPNGKYRYKFGLSIVLNQESHRITKVINGKTENE